MKKSLCLTTLVGLVAEASCSTRVVEAEKTKQEVTAALEQCVWIVVREDLETQGKIVSHGPETMKLGVRGAPVVGWEVLRDALGAQFANFDTVQIDQSQVQVQVLPGGLTAWATSLWRFRYDH